MNRQGHENVEYFLGPEVELTPAHGKRTLFVVGFQELDEVIAKARETKVTHVYLGANHSFNVKEVLVAKAGPAWNTLVAGLLDRGFFVSIDYEAHLHVNALELFTPSVWQSRLFIPILSVRIPKVQNSSLNLTIKIDDIDFNATNEGVWCMSYREATDSNRFTGWAEYTTDQTLSAMETTAAKSHEITATVNTDTGRKVFSVDIGDMPAAKVAAALETIKESIRVIEATPVINEIDTGLDKDSKSALKPETQEDIVSNLPMINTSPLDAAALYAEGAKTDPVKESTAKHKVKK